MSVRIGAAVVAFAVSICMSLQSDAAQSKKLPPGIVKALTDDEKAFCDRYLGDYKKGCRQIFRTNLFWRELEVTPKGPTAFLVENHNLGFCGSAGCSIYLFVLQADSKFAQVLGKDGDVGALDQITVLKTSSAGYYDIQKEWSDEKTRTIYKWEGRRYSSP